MTSYITLEMNGHDFQFEEMTCSSTNDHGKSLQRQLYLNSHVEDECV